MGQKRKDIVEQNKTRHNQEKTRQDKNGKNISNDRAEKKTIGQNKCVVRIVNMQYMYKRRETRRDQHRKKQIG